MERPRHCPFCEPKTCRSGAIKLCDNYYLHRDTGGGEEIVCNVQFMRHFNLVITPFSLLACPGLLCENGRF